MKVNLNHLAVELARMDNPKGRNEDVVAAKTMLAALGRLCREKLTTVETVEVLAAIVSRAGRN